MVRFPSVQSLARRAYASFVRFPMVLVSALVATCFGIYLVWLSEVSDAFLQINLMLTAFMGIPLYFCATVLTERLRLRRAWIWQVGVTLILGLLYFSLPNYDSFQHVDYQPYTRYAMFGAVALLLVSFAAYVKDRGVWGFWNYNKTLLFLFSWSLLHSGVLYIGTALALVAMDSLFDLVIEEKVYAYCFICIGALFNTWFFVSQVPRSLHALDDEENPPASLRVFVQYVLLPLLGSYLIILYAYSIKILVSEVWPKGIMAYLVVGVALLGILALLLIYPYGAQKEHTWIKRFTRYYYYLLIPLVGMLFVAIGIRISDYGITINRYAIASLGVWLFGVCIYFAIGKTNIRVIPISLAVVFMLTSFGPWGVLQVSQRSQESRLYDILNRHGVIVNGKLVHESLWDLSRLPQLHLINPRVNDFLLNDSLRREVQSIVRYLSYTHNLYQLAPLFRQSIDSVAQVAISNDKSLKKPKIYMQSLGLSPVNTWVSGHRFYTAATRTVTPTEGYAYMVDVIQNSTNRVTTIMDFKAGQHEYALVYSNSTKTDLMIITREDSLRLGLNTLVHKLEKDSSEVDYNAIDPSKMIVVQSSPRLRVKFLVSSLEVSRPDNSIVSVTGQLWLSEEGSTNR